MSVSRDIFEDDSEGESERYHCLVEIGRGGMAVVYRAWDSHMNRDVALKVAREDVAADPEVRRRFEEESRIGGAFSHPNILPVFDRGSYAGRPYLAMQLIDGMPLDRANLPLRDAMDRLAAAAEAVDYAHARGVIHRDLKPSNILLARDGRVYLTDFGVARQTTAEDRRTVAGTVVGTPAYMSPEQARGEDVDARADVYALGATLYELAVGRPPYEGKDPQAVLEAVRTRPPLAPRKANPKVSRNVEAIIRMAMERLPGDRYATARALAEDLRLYQNRRRPLARARGFRYYVGRELVRHPIRTSARLLTALIVAGALILGGLVGRSWLDYRRALAEPDVDRRLELLEEAAAYYPPARGPLKTLRAGLAEAERARVERIRTLEAEIRKELQLEDFVKAGGLLGELSKLRPDSADQLQIELDRRKTAAEGRALVAGIRRRLAAGDLRGAAEDLRRLSPAHPDRDGLLELLRQGRYAEIVAALLKAAEEGDPGRFAPLFDEAAAPAHAVEKDRNADLGKAARTLGLALAEKGNRADTILWLSEAEARGVADADLYRVRGLARLAERSWDAAEGDLERFRQHAAPGTPAPSAYWELFHQRSKEAVKDRLWPKAQTLLHQALELSKDQAVLWHDLGLVRWKTVNKPELSFGDLDQALRKDRALKPAPEYAAIALAWVDRVGAALDLETPAERDFHWSHLLARLDQVAGPERSEELRVVRASLLRKLRRADEALAELASAGDSARVRLARARAHASAAARPDAPEGALARAYEQVAGARPGSPDDAAVLAWKAVLGARLGRASAADFQAAQARGGLFAAARLDHARLLQGAGAHAAVLKELELALADRLGEDDLLWLGAEPLAKPVSLARAELRRAVLLLRARTRFASGDMGACVDDAALLLDEAPAPEPRLLRGLARLQLPKPDAKGAAEDLEAYLLVHPDDTRARLALASACLKLDRARDAEECCRLVLSKKPDLPEALYLRGLARKELGNAVGARSDFEAARDACPPGSPLLPALERELRPR